MTTIRHDIYVNSYDTRGLPKTFCDENGNNVKDIEWAAWDIIVRKNYSKKYAIAPVGYYANQLMGIVIEQYNENNTRSIK